MKWRGINRKLTPVAPGTHFAQNVRLDVDGEMRRRRGIARASFAKQAGAIYGLGAHSTPGTIVAGVGTSVEGLDGGGLEWGDAQLGAPICEVSIAGLVYTFTVSPTSPWTRSILIYARLATDPVANETLILEIDLLPGATEGVDTWTAPTALEYVFRCAETAAIGLGPFVDVEEGEAPPCSCDGGAQANGTATLSAPCFGAVGPKTLFFVSFNSGAQSCTWMYETRDGSGFTEFEVGLTYFFDGGLAGTWFFMDPLISAFPLQVHDLACVNGNLTGSFSHNTGALCLSPFSATFP